MANLPKWEPSENQVAALKYAQGKDYDVSHKALGQACSPPISRQAVDQWFYGLGESSRRFLEWWDEHNRAWFRARVWRTRSAIARGADGKPMPKGHSAEARLHLEAADETFRPTTRQEQGGPGSFDGRLESMEQDVRTPEDAPDVGETD